MHNDGETKPFCRCVCEYELPSLIYRELIKHWPETDLLKRVAVTSVEELVPL